MEIEKAIKNLKERIRQNRIIAENPTVFYTSETMEQGIKTMQDGIEVSELAIQALEKQIPKNPIINPWSTAKCPCCDAQLGEYLEDGYVKIWESIKICDCGQKLDWSDEQ